MLAPKLGSADRGREYQQKAPAKQITAGTSRGPRLVAIAARPTATTYREPATAMKRASAAPTT